MLVLLILALAPLATVRCSPSPSVTDAADYYAGKTVRIIVPFGPGGGYDLHARIMAQRLGTYLPGRPTVVVENMPGAGGLVAAMHFAQYARPNGLTLGVFSTGIVLHELVTREKESALDTRVKRYAVVGSPGADFDVCFFSTASGMVDYEAWVAATPAPRMGMTGPGAGSYLSTMIVTDALGLPVRPVVGYRGTAEIKQAMESGEIDGSCSTWSGFKTVHGRQNAHLIAVQAGLQRAPALAHVPAALEFATNDDSRDLLRALARMGEIGRFYALPPGTPSDLVTQLRAAVLKTMSDPQFLRDAETTGLSIDPMSGEGVSTRIAALFALSDETRDRLTEIVGPVPQ